MLILASASPRRKQTLEKLGVQFDVFPVDIDESPLINEAPVDYVNRLALEKAKACLQLTSSKKLILASDTTVALGDQIMGKPRDREDGVSMLKHLSGNLHQVHTAFSLVDASGLEYVECVTTEVEFVPLDGEMIDAYWHTGEPCDKAGGYGIQGIGGSFVKRLNGSFSAVVGLPEQQVITQLRKLGIKSWIEAQV